VLVISHMTLGIILMGISTALSAGHDMAAAPPSASGPAHILPLEGGSRHGEKSVSPPSPYTAHYVTHRANPKANPSTKIAAKPLTLYAYPAPPLVLVNGHHPRAFGPIGDIVDAVFTGAAIPYQTQRRPMKRAISAVMSNADSCAYFFLKTKARVDRFKWVGPIFKNHYAFFSYDPDIVRPPQKGRDKILMMNGTKIYEEALAAGWSLRPVSKALSALQALRSGRADYLLASLDMMNITADAAIMQRPRYISSYSISDLYIACSPAVPDAIIEQLQSSLQTVAILGVP